MGDFLERGKKTIQILALAGGATAAVAIADKIKNPAPEPKSLADAQARTKTAEASAKALAGKLKDIEKEIRLKHEEVSRLNTQLTLEKARNRPGADAARAAELKIKLDELQEKYDTKLGELNALKDSKGILEGAPKGAPVQPKVELPKAAPKELPRAEPKELRPEPKAKESPKATAPKKLEDEPKAAVPLKKKHEGAPAKKTPEVTPWDFK